MVDAPVSEGQPMGEQAHMVPLWIPILIAAIMVIIPVTGYLVYILHMRRKPEESQDAVSTPVIVDVERQTSESRPSTNRWTLTVPKWTSQAASIRRGSDGGFPPGTRHITFPDPTLAASVESLDHKAPPSPGPLPTVVSPVNFRYPTPPPVIVTRPDERYYAHGHAR